MSRTVLFLALALALPVAAAWGQATVNDEALAAAQAVLREAMADTPRGAEVLRGLRATNDKALLPALTAMCESPERLRRLFAVLAAGELGGAESAETMRRRFRDDGDAGIRGVALNALIQQGAAREDDLQLALASRDDNLGLMAGRELLRRGSAPAAVDVLMRIADGPDEELSALARMLLLSAGQANQAARLEALLTDPQQPQRLKLLLLGLAGKDVVRPALPIVQRLAAAPADDAVHAEALRALAALAPAEGAKTIADELARSDDPIFQVRLMQILSAVPNHDAQLAALRDSRSPVVAALARLEQARYTGNDVELSSSAAALMKTGHPIVADYVIRRAGETPDPAYVPALLDYIRSVPPRQAQMGAEHQEAASAAVVLVKLSTPAAEEGLAAILRGPYDSVSRSVAGGLVVAEGPCLLRLAEIILHSPYDELSTSAALTLGKAGDARAADVLADIVRHRDRYPTGLSAMASWYLLKIAGRQDDFARELAGQAR